MLAETTNPRGLNWALPLYVAAATTILALSLMVYSAYADFVYVFLIGPTVCLILLVLIGIAALRKRRRLCLSPLLALAAFVLVSAALVVNEDGLRPSLRWLLWSRRFKAEVLAQSAPADGELRHIEWEATGFAGVNNTVYLVFDPSDSLSAAASSHAAGKYKGIPCKVPRVRRLEPQWYSVWFYTDEAWGQRNASNCTGPS